MPNESKGGVPETSQVREKLAAEAVRACLAYGVIWREAMDFKTYEGLHAKSTELSLLNILVPRILLVSDALVVNKNKAAMRPMRDESRPWGDCFVEAGKRFGSAARVARWLLISNNSNLLYSAKTNDYLERRRQDAYSRMTFGLIDAATDSPADTARIDFDTRVVQETIYFPGDQMAVTIGLSRLPKMLERSTDDPSQRVISPTLDSYLNPKS